MVKLSDGTEMSMNDLSAKIDDGEMPAKQAYGMIVEMTLGRDMMNLSELPEIDGKFAGLRRVVVPDGYDRMPSVYECPALEEIIASNTVQELTDIYDCPKLRTLTIGSGLTDFYPTIGCPDVEIRISEDNQTFKTQNGFVFTKDGSAVLQYFGKDRTVTIPDSVTSI